MCCSGLASGNFSTSQDETGTFAYAEVSGTQANLLATFASGAQLNLDLEYTNSLAGTCTGSYVPAPGQSPKPATGCFETLAVR